MPEYTHQDGSLVPRASARPGTGASDGPVEFLRPLVNQWLIKIRQAESAKAPFQEIADQCSQFYSKSSGFMWESEYLKKHMGSGIQTPKFQVTLQKAFELVAIFGPYLFWKNPNVWIQTEEPIELSPELFGDPNDPNVMQMFEQAQMESAADLKRQDLRNDLMEKYLNYSQREQPGGGLAVHAELAITEALVKGRGCTWVEDYTFPGSDRRLTGRFFDSVDNLLIDPDSISPTLDDANYIIRKHWNHSWELEELFELPKDALKHLGKAESAASQAANNGGTAGQYRRNGMTNDLIPWFEIWSKSGVATRSDFTGDGNSDFNSDVHNEFDKNVGDFAYLCVSPSIPWPLNCPRSSLSKMNNEQVKERFQWRTGNYGSPFPSYLDKRWPVALLDFNRNPDSAWPIAPLAPALGELICMNVLISAFVDQAYENRKQLIAYMGSAGKKIREALKSRENPALLEINDAAQQSIDKMIGFLNRPGMNNDLLDAIGVLSGMFDKRTGLTEIMYSMNVGGSASRTARDVESKEEKASIRPDKMAQDVARFMTEGADLEKFLAGWTVEGGDLLPLLGKYGAYFWDQLIASEDPEVFVREMRATVESSDIRKPNRERLSSNLRNMMQTLLPVLEKYSVDTGDTSQLNAYFDAMGDSMEQDFGKWALGPWRPEPSEEQQQAAQLEQQQLQADLQKTMMEVQKSQAEIQKTQVETQIQAATGGVDVKKQQMELQFDQAKNAQELQIEQLKLGQELKIDKIKHGQEMQKDSQKHVQDVQQDQQKFVQDMSQDKLKHVMGIFQKRAENQIKIEGMQMQNRMKAQAPKNGSAK